MSSLAQRVDDEAAPARRRVQSLAVHGIWRAGGGAVDVFSVCVREGVVAWRSHVARIPAGEPLFGVSTAHASASFEAVASGGAWIEPHPSPRAPGSSADEPTASLMESWIAALSLAAVSGRAVVDAEPLDCGTSVDVRAGTLVQPRSGVAWLRQRSGCARLVGGDDLRIEAGDVLACGHRAWLQVDADATIDVVDAVRADAEQIAWPGLAALHELVLRGSVAAAAAADTATQARARQRNVEERSTLSRAFGQLAATLDPGAQPSVVAPQPQSSDGYEQVLFAACRRVFAAIDVQARRQSGAQKSRDPVAALAKASRVRARRVLLREGWWSRDNGPLLARLAEPKRPVALVPTSPTRYVLEDPTTGAQSVVTAEVAATLEPIAYTFYRPFEASPLGWRQIVRFASRGRARDGAVVLLMAAAVGLLGLVAPMATGSLFNTIIPSANRSQLIQMTVILLVTALAVALFDIVRRLALTRLDGRVGASVQAAVWDRLLSLAMPFFRPYAAGDLAVRAMGIDTIRQMLSGAVVTTVIGSVFSLFNVGLLFYYGGSLAWLAMLLVAASMTATLAAAMAQLRLQRRISPLRAKASGVVLQLLTGISKLRVAGAEVHAFGRWVDLFTEQRRLQYRTRRIGNWLSMFTSAFPIVASLILFSLIAKGVATEGAMRTGDFLAFLAAFGICLSAALSTGTAVLGVLGAIPLYEMARPILQATPEVDEGKADPGTLSGALDIDHVHFSYDPDGLPTLQDVSIRIRPEEFVAVVGPSGSGKSTLLRLLLGFEQPGAGAIYYDGQDLSGLDIGAVRHQIGVVLQSGRLMSGDIYTNIVGTSSATLNDAWAAARMAGLDDDIKQMPMGMHTVVSNGASTLSGGQRQRLLIARAIVSKPRILLFDEATSALDNRTQAIVTNSLATLRATRIVIAHRLSTVVNADRIFVMERGRIVETGTYDELMRRDGVFAQLARRQLV